MIVTSSVPSSKKSIGTSSVPFFVPLLALIKSSKKVPIGLAVFYLSSNTSFPHIFFPKISILPFLFLVQTSTLRCSHLTHLTYLLKLLTDTNIHLLFFKQVLGSVHSLSYMHCDIHETCCNRIFNHNPSFQCVPIPIKCYFMPIFSPLYIAKEYYLKICKYVIIHQCNLFEFSSTKS